MSELSSAVFPWNFTRSFPIAAYSDGVYMHGKDGKKYLDGSGGAVAVTIGHSVRAVTEEICRMLSRLPYAHTSHFHTRVGEELATYLARKFPASPQGTRVLFTSGGSEATESAIKVVRQHWLCRGEPRRYKIISRWHSYHGATLGALGLSGNRRRREPYAPLLPRSRHIASCFCYHCPLGLQFPTCKLACAHELEASIIESGKDTVAGFILEPVVGATSGAVPADGYLRAIREICDRYGILLIADEVMTGSGRTGRYFAVEHWDIRPDLILMGKGLSSGYSPLGAVLVAEHVWQPIQKAAASLEHSFTYQAHPPSLAAGLAVQKYLEKNNLVERVVHIGEYLRGRLEAVKGLPCVGNVRGMGLLWTVEFVADREKRLPFHPQCQFSERVFHAMRERGVMLYPGRGTVDGTRGDHVLIAPPFIITESEIDFLVAQLEISISRVYGDVGAPH